MEKSLRKSLKELYKNDTMSKSLLMKLLEATKNNYEMCANAELNGSAPYFKAKLDILSNKLAKGLYEGGVK